MSACSAALVATAFNWFSCPLFPRPPSPAGKGEIFSLLCWGLRPRHLGLNLRGTGVGACPCAVGGLPLPRRLGVLLVLLLPPIPPTALAERSSPAGKGEIYSYLMQGAPPLASPGLEPGRHWFVPV